MTYLGPPRYLRAFAEAGQRLLSGLEATYRERGFAVFEFLIARESERDDLAFVAFTSRPPAHSQNSRLLDDIALLEENATIVPPRESAPERLQEISAALELRRIMKRRFGNGDAADLIEIHEPTLVQEAYSEIDKLMGRYEGVKIPTDVGAAAVIYRAWQRGLIDERIFEGLVQFGSERWNLAHLVERMAYRLGLTDATLRGEGDGILDGRRWREAPPDYLSLWTEYSLIHRLRYDDNTKNVVMIHYPLVVEKDCFLGFAYFISHCDNTDDLNDADKYIRRRALLSALFEEPFKFIARENAIKSISVEDEQHSVVVQAARVIFPCFEISDVDNSHAPPPGAIRRRLASWTAFLPDNSVASAWLTQELRLLETALRGPADAVAGVREEEAIGAKAVQYQQKRMREARAPMSGYESDVLWKAARSGINGDLYGIVEVDGGYIAYVGDVQGKGIFAVMAWEAYRNVITSILRTTSDVSTFLRRLHERAREANLLQIDMAIAHVDAATGRCTLAKTGTARAAVLRRSEYVPVTESHFGIISAPTTKPDAIIEPAVFDLVAGDTVLLFTDGVTDATNDDEEEFGAERLARYVRPLGGHPPSAVAAHIDYVLTEFVHGAPRIDDVTILIIQRLMPNAIPST
jgi:hypothetical protein